MKHIFFKALTIVFLFSCSNDIDKEIEKPDTNLIESFAFCKTGNQWTYINYSLSSPEIIIHSQAQIISVNADGWIMVKQRMIVEYDVWWYANSRGFSDMAAPPSDYLYLFQKDAEVGDIYEESFIDEDKIVTNRNQIVALSQTITVPAGTFTGCTKIRQTTSEDVVCYYDIWFSPEVGVIKKEGTTTEDYPDIMVTELQSVNF